MTFKFADDPSDCPAYLYCHYNGATLESVHQGKCTTGNFDAATASCDTTLTCTDPCEFNPVGTKIKVIVKD